MLSTLVVLVAVSLGTTAEDVVVTTRLGQLRGTRVSTGPSTYLDTFLGVPYAKPPVGALRLAATQPVAPWRGTLDATRYGPACPQLSQGATSEDCLTLNIVAPGSRPCNQDLLPVMVFIHGGGFWEGGGASFNGTRLAQKGVVFVTINYRLDILGFLSTQDDASPGNYGLLDAIQALKWIKANIASFGGNPTDVTIFGESAGGAICSHLRSSPLAQGLFQKVIMESGVSVCKWAFMLPTNTPSPLTSAQALATKLGCPVNQGSGALVTCVKNQPLDRLLNVSASLRASYLSVFVPVVETGFGVLPKAPEQLIREGAGSGIIAIRGNNRDEVMLSPSMNLTDAETTIMQQASLYFPRGAQQATTALLQEYILEANYTTSLQIAQGVNQIGSDLYFNYPMLRESLLSASIPGAARQYVYQFSYLSPRLGFPGWAASSRRPLPVMMWIHGGGLMQGSGAYYNGTELAQRAVIVVTINYRLDVLGFMSTLDKHCPGNFGLLDQILALRWIRANIASFHGNPNDVTVFGNSAGAASVSFLRVSPLARGLFHKAIMESGGSLGAWTGGYPANTSQPLAMARALGAKVGCNNVSTAALVTCLRRQPAATLINASAILNLEITESFLPVVGDTYGLLPAHPFELLRQGKGRHVTSIRGVNADEYLYFTLVYTGLFNYEPDKAEQTIRNVLSRSIPLDVLDNVTRAAIQLYVTRPGRTTPEQIRYSYSELMTDFYYVAPVVLETEMAVRIPSAARQYLYVFDYTPRNASWTGVPHETELPFVFGQAASHQARFYNMPRFTWTPADTALSDHIMTMWTNLAKFGNPTPEEVNGTTWAPYSVDTQSYLNISTRLLTGSHLRQEQVEFWRAIFNDLYT